MALGQYMLADGGHICQNGFGPRGPLVRLGNETLWKQRKTTKSETDSVLFASFPRCIRNDRRFPNATTFGVGKKQNYAHSNRND